MMLVLKSGSRCEYCGYPFREDIYRHSFSVDHVKPISQGGTDEIENLKAACRACNTSKGVKNLEQFREMLTRQSSYFTDDQMELLQAYSIELPPELLPVRHKFHFEIEALKPEVADANTPF